MAITKTKPDMQDAISQQIDQLHKQIDFKSEEIDKLEDEARQYSNKVQDYADSLSEVIYGWLDHEEPFTKADLTACHKLLDQIYATVQKATPLWKKRDVLDKALESLYPKIRQLQNKLPKNRCNCSCNSRHND